MGRVATGNVINHAHGRSARVRLGPGDRPSFPLPRVLSDAEADERAELLAGLAKRLRGRLARAELADLVTMGAAAATSKELAGVLEAADAIEKGEVSKASSALAPTKRAARLRASEPPAALSRGGGAGASDSRRCAMSATRRAKLAPPAVATTVVRVLRALSGHTQEERRRILDAVCAIQGLKVLPVLPATPRRARRRRDAKPVPAPAPPSNVIDFAARRAARGGA